MFQLYIKYLIYWVIQLSLLAVLTACTEGKTLENFLGADPQLQQTKEQTKEQTENDNQIAQDNTSKPKQAEPNSSGYELTEQELAEEIDSINVPANFPENIPIYPQANLLEIEAGTTEEQNKTTWRSPDSLEQIKSFYQQEFQENDNHF